MKLKNVILVLVALIALGAAAQAGTATADLAVSASVTANCLISTSAVSFGSYDPVSANSSAALDSTGTVTVRCTNGSGAVITLGQGANADSASTDAAPVRRLIAGTDYLGYNLFQDSGHASVWGNTAGTGVGHTGTGADVALTVYGEISGAQNVPAGNYADTVVATVTF